MYLNSINTGSMLRESIISEKREKTIMCVCNSSLEAIKIVGVCFEISPCAQIVLFECCFKRLNEHLVMKIKTINLSAHGIYAKYSGNVKIH
jgi:hypothetical protein